METFLLILVVVTLTLIAYKLHKIHILILNRSLEDNDVIPHQVDENDYDEAKNFVITTGKASTSALQTNFKWGYFKTAMIMKKLEEDKVVSHPEQGKRYRSVLNK